MSVYVKVSLVAMAEWLRRQTRNLLGKPAQVRILLATFFSMIRPLLTSYTHNTACLIALQQYYYLSDTFE